MVEISDLRKIIQCTVAKVGKTNGLLPTLPEYATIILVRLKHFAEIKHSHKVCFIQILKIQVSNVELMVFATAQEMATHLMMTDNVYLGINAQVIFLNKTSLQIFVGYAPECPPNEVYNDCNKGYEPFCCEQSMNEMQSRQFAQVNHSISIFL